MRWWYEGRDPTPNDPRDVVVTDGHFRVHFRHWRAALEYMHYQNSKED